MASLLSTFPSTFLCFSVSLRRAGQEGGRGRWEGQEGGAGGRGRREGQRGEGYDGRGREGYETQIHTYRYSTVYRAHRYVQQSLTHAL